MEAWESYVGNYRRHIYSSAGIETPLVLLPALVIAKRLRKRAVPLCSVSLAHKCPAAFSPPRSRHHLPLFEDLLLLKISQALGLRMQKGKCLKTMRCV